MQHKIKNKQHKKNHKVYLDDSILTHIEYRAFGLIVFWLFYMLKTSLQVSLNINLIYASVQFTYPFTFLFEQLLLISVAQGRGKREVNINIWKTKKACKKKKMTKF